MPPTRSTRSRSSFQNKTSNKKKGKTTTTTTAPRTQTQTQTKPTRKTTRKKSSTKTESSITNPKAADKLPPTATTRRSTRQRGKRQSQSNTTTNHEPKTTTTAATKRRRSTTSRTYVTASSNSSSSEEEDNQDEDQTQLRWTRGARTAAAAATAEPGRITTTTNSNNKDDYSQQTHTLSAPTSSSPIMWIVDTLTRIPAVWSGNYGSTSTSASDAHRRSTTQSQQQQTTAATRQRERNRYAGGHASSKRKLALLSDDEIEDNSSESEDDQGPATPPHHHTSKPRNSAVKAPNSRFSLLPPSPMTAKGNTNANAQQTFARRHATPPLPKRDHIFSSNAHEWQQQQRSGDQQDGATGSLLHPRQRRGSSSSAGAFLQSWCDITCSWLIIIATLALAFYVWTLLQARLINQSPEKTQPSIPVPEPLVPYCEHRKRSGSGSSSSIMPLVPDPCTGDVSWWPDGAYDTSRDLQHCRDHVVQLASERSHSTLVQELNEQLRIARQEGKTHRHKLGQLEMKYAHLKSEHSVVKNMLFEERHAATEREKTLEQQRVSYTVPPPTTTTTGGDDQVDETHQQVSDHEEQCSVMKVQLSKAKERIRVLESIVNVHETQGVTKEASTRSSSGSSTGGENVVDSQVAVDGSILSVDDRAMEHLRYDDVLNENASSSCEGMHVRMRDLIHRVTLMEADSADAIDSVADMMRKFRLGDLLAGEAVNTHADASAGRSFSSLLSGTALPLDRLHDAKSQAWAIVTVMWPYVRLFFILVGELMLFQLVLPTASRILTFICVLSVAVVAFFFFLERMWLWALLAAWNVLLGLVFVVRPSLALNASMKGNLLAVE